MHRTLIAVASTLVLAACGMQGQDNDKSEKTTATESPVAADQWGYETFSADNLADSMASNDAAAGVTSADENPLMQVQVLLDRQGFGPGVIDGKSGLSMRNALRGFQESQGLDETGELDEKTRAALAALPQVAATREVTIPQSWGKQSYRPTPEDPAEQAKLASLAYQSIDERLAERFHTTVDVLRELNPVAAPTPAATPKAAASDAPPASAFRAGQKIRVPNIGADSIEKGVIENADWQRTLASLGVGTGQPEVAKVVVSKRAGTLKGYDSAGKLVALFTVTTGSQHDPLPLGEWKILGKSYNPTYSYNPALLRNAPKDAEKQQLPAGPNSPVGVIWIDLSKDHYGLHGTPEPEHIGRTESNGCVRLTNWDAARLAQMVSQSTQVLFEA